MKLAPPTLSPLLRSDAQGDLLALVFLHPDEEFSLSDIARRIGTSLPWVHAEVQRLSLAGLLGERRVGQSRLVRAAADHPLIRPLTELLELTYGPTAVLPEILSALPDIREAHVYGSWAARRLGEPGPAPRDIDVVVVGRVSRAALTTAGEEAGRRLGREVNLTRVAPDVWDAGQDPFVRTLRSRPLVPVPLPDDPPVAPR